MHQFIKTMDVVNALEEKLASLKFPAELIPSNAATEITVDTPVFEIVSKQSTPSLAHAVEKAIAVTERLACIVPGRERFENVQNGGAASTKRIQTFLILMSGVDFDPFAATSFYGSDLLVGLVDIKDYVIDQIYGESLTIKNALVVPKGGESARFASDDTDLATIREGYILTIDVAMGVKQACSSRGMPTRRI